MRSQIEIMYKEKYRKVSNIIRLHLDKLENATTDNYYKVKLGLEISRVNINKNYIYETCIIIEKAIMLTDDKVIGKYMK